MRGPVGGHALAGAVGGGECPLGGTPRWSVRKGQQRQSAGDQLQPQFHTLTALLLGRRSLSLGRGRGGGRLFCLCFSLSYSFFGER